MPMPPEPPSLAELQARFQAAVMHGADDVLGLIPDNSRTSNAVLFGVYRHAYVARLVEVVQGAHPLLAVYMGPDAFVVMARAYVETFPSTYRNARWFSGRLPEFLESGPFASRPELRELALIERQLDFAFDAADAEVLDLAGLSAHPPDLWSALTFTPHPSVAILSLATNSLELWLALKDEQSWPAARRLAEPDPVIVWRQEGTARIRRLGAEEHMLWREMARGATFATLNEMAAVFDDPGTAAIRVAQHLKGWLDGGFLSAAVISAQEGVRV